LQHQEFEIGRGIEYCFRQLGLNRIELKCAATNFASMRVAERLGFSREGVLRQAEFLDGAFVDHHVYGLLRSDANAMK
jgi:ribosomal-protein-serine acetyltransferase